DLHIAGRHGGRIVRQRRRSVYARRRKAARHHQALSHQPHVALSIVGGHAPFVGEVELDPVPWQIATRGERDHDAASAAAPPPVTARARGALPPPARTPPAATAAAASKASASVGYTSSRIGGE